MNMKTNFNIEKKNTVIFANLDKMSNNYTFIIFIRSLTFKSDLSKDLKATFSIAHTKHKIINK